MSYVLHSDGTLSYYEQAISIAQHDGIAVILHRSSGRVKKHGVSHNVFEWLQIKNAESIESGKPHQFDEFIYISLPINQENILHINKAINIIGYGVNLIPPEIRGIKIQYH